MICLKIIPRFFCLPVNQLLFALSKRLVLQVPNLITATNFSDKLNYNFYHLKKKTTTNTNDITRLGIIDYDVFLNLSKKVLTRSEKFSHANKDWFTVFPLFISCKLICNLNLNIY